MSKIEFLSLGRLFSHFFLNNIVLIFVFGSLFSPSFEATLAKQS